MSRVNMGCQKNERARCNTELFTKTINSNHPISGGSHHLRGASLLFCPSARDGTKVSFVQKNALLGQTALRCGCSCTCGNHSVDLGQRMHGCQSRNPF